MIKRTTKIIAISIVLLGFVGCNDGDKSHEEISQAPQNEKQIANPLDSLTASLPQGINAKEARDITDVATKKLFDEYFLNGAGKDAINNTIAIINARIERMTKNGVFDGTNLNTFMANSAYGNNAQSDLRPMIGYLHNMNDAQKELYKRLIVNYYVQKGYKVIEGQNNFTNDFHYSINW